MVLEIKSHVSISLTSGNNLPARDASHLVCVHCCFFPSNSASFNLVHHSVFLGRFQCHWLEQAQTTCPFYQTVCSIWTPVLTRSSCHHSHQPASKKLPLCEAETPRRFRNSSFYRFSLQNSTGPYLCSYLTQHNTLLMSLVFYHFMSLCQC